MIPIRSLPLLAALVVPDATAGAGETRPFIGWSLSTSDQDPFVNTAAPVVGEDSLYIWFACTADTLTVWRDRMTAAQFDIVGNLDGVEALPIGVN
jgi:hypothetical protein